MFRSSTLPDARSAVDSARASAVTGAAELRERAAPAVATARETARDVTRERVIPAATAAKAVMVPALATAAVVARDTLHDVATGAREAIAPHVEDPLESVQGVLEEARGRGVHAVAALRGEELHSRRWPFALGFLLVGMVLGAVAGLLARRLSSDESSLPPADETDPLAMPPGVVSASTTAPAGAKPFRA